MKIHMYLFQEKMSFLGEYCLSTGVHEKNWFIFPIPELSGKAGHSRFGKHVRDEHRVTRLVETKNQKKQALCATGFVHTLSLRAAGPSVSGAQLTSAASGAGASAGLLLLSLLRRGSISTPAKNEFA